MAKGITKIRPNAYTYIERMERAQYTVDFVTGKEPAERLPDFYKRQAVKPTRCCNGGLYNRKTGSPIFTYEDENITKSASSYNVGMGVSAAGLMYFGTASNPDFKDFVSAYPLLVFEGKKVNATYATEIGADNPRTVLGYSDQYYFMCLVDGGAKNAPGITFSELADLMLSVGATCAVNLDGGGSTIGLDESGTIINHPTEIRAVDNMVCFYYTGTNDEETKKKMGVKAYNKYTDAGKKLSTNFTVREFACNDGSGALLIAEELVVLLQKIREHFGKAVTVNSGYRNNSYNKSIGGATASHHLQGTAADIVISGVTPRAVAEYADSLGAGGVGLYEYPGGFTHVDVRAGRSRWIQKSKNGGAATVTGF